MATPTIPISQVVDIVPGVVGTGGNPLSLNAVAVSNNTTLVPTSQFLEFTDPDAVGDYFGSSSSEKEEADKYFAGYDNSFKKPGTLYFAGYATAATGAWLRGTSIAGMTLTELKAITGSLSLYIDSDEYQTTTDLDLSAVTSFTDAATAIKTALGIGVGDGTVTWDAAHSVFVVASLTTGATSTITFATGTAASALGLDAGVLNQGVAADTPASAMDRIKDQGNNWATFFTTFVPALEVDRPAFLKGFGDWVTTQNDEYLYIAWDNANGYKTANNPAVFGSIVNANKIGGTYVVYGEAIHAAASAGYVASIDFQAVNGRATAAFKSQEGLATTVNNLADANAVLSNGATYYGAYGARGGNLDNCFYNGQMPGSKFKWVDTYVNQIYLNSQLRLAIWNGLRSVNYAPYNAQGETLIRSWCADPIAEALNNGTIQTGIQLSASQKATIAQQAGLDISNELYGQGYYLQILPATAQIRGQRQSPPCKLWYTDGGSIQAISLASIAIL